MRLTIELIPESTWFNNVRSAVSEAKWDELKRLTFKKAGYRCEICGGQGSRWPVECHEIWGFTPDFRQELRGLIALCPDCHEVKHFGFAASQGREEKALTHLMRVNQINREEAAAYVTQVFLLWEARSQYKWTVDLSWLNSAPSPTGH